MRPPAEAGVAEEQALNAIEELSADYAGDRRWRIEHAQVVDPADIAPLAQKAGEATADASGKLAEKSRTWAAGTRESLAGSRPTDATDVFDTDRKTDPPTTI